VICGPGRVANHRVEVHTLCDPQVRLKEQGRPGVRGWTALQPAPVSVREVANEEEQVQVVREVSEEGAHFPLMAVDRESVQVGEAPRVPSQESVQVRATPRPGLRPGLRPGPHRYRTGLRTRLVKTRKARSPAGRADNGEFWFSWVIWVMSCQVGN
jgi:hypothetical protein